MSSASNSAEANYSATSLTIDEVMDAESGDLRGAAALIGSDYARLICLRNDLEERIAAGKPRIVCPVCSQALRIRCGRRNKGDPRLNEDFHFWHGRGHSRCPLSQASTHSREYILAAKYHGQREGPAHIRLKHLIHESLCCDDRFTDVAIERTWKLEGDPRHWRRPDVCARFHDVPVVFEIQLSTTFVSVMAERRHFYREQGALLVWIVANFNPSWTALAHEDIFYPNNRNLFVANDETLSTSRDTRKFTLDVHWQEPCQIGAAKTDFRHLHRLIEFGELTRDVRKQRTYYVDVEAAEERVQHAIAQTPLRSDFERHWFAYLRGTTSRAEAVQQEKEWGDLRHRFEQCGIKLPQHHYLLEPLLNSIYSARDVQPERLVGWGHVHLVTLAHHLFEKHKRMVWPFRIALRVYEREAMVCTLDATRKWRKKVPKYLDAIARGDEDYQPPGYAAPLLTVLFPELAEALAVIPSEAAAAERAKC